MLTTASATPVNTHSVRCGLGFHQWEIGIDEWDAQCFICTRCGAVDPYDESNIVLHAMSGSAGRITDTPR